MQATRGLRQALGVEAVLLGQHAGGQGLNCISVEYGGFGLTDDRAGVDAFGHPMDRAAMAVMTCGERPGVGIDAWKVRQEARVNVDHPTAPSLDEPRGKDAHIARQGHQFDAGAAERRIDRLLMSFTVALEGAVINRDGRDPGVAGDLQPASTGRIGEHNNDLSRIVRVFGRVYQGG